MSRYAVVKSGTVCNVILWDGESEYEPESGSELIAVGDDVSIGWLRENDEWVAPEPTEPELPPAEDPAVIEAKQNALLALTALGVPEADARTIVGLPPA